MGSYEEKSCEDLRNPSRYHCYSTRRWPVRVTTTFFIIGTKLILFTLFLSSCITMAGLESIALAVLHLEREAEIQKAAVPVSSVGSEEDPIVPATQGVSVAFVPKRSGFSGPRLVSTDYSMTKEQVETPTGSMNTDQNPQAMMMPFNTSTTTIATTTSPPQQEEPAQVSTRTLETVVDMDLVDATIKEAPPVPKLTDVISRVLENDVLCGRGGETNHHSGNIQYRQLVKACQPSYIAAKRRDKPKIAEKIVRTVRKLGGRFLKKNPETNTWRDVGNGKAREKTSQALREGAPELRTGKEKRGSMSTTDSLPVMPVKRRNLVPRVVEDMDLPAEPSLKKLKTSVSDPASTEAGKTSPPPQQYGATAPVAKTATRQVSSDSPGGFTATISADDGEEDDSKCFERKSSRGPLLKLLKRRMECSTNDTV
jgi:hypothetical protein